MKLAGEYLKNVSFEFHRYKTYGDKTLEQLNEEQLHWRPSENDNSISLLVKHMAGNMLSRWTNFLNEDGEKEWRNRDEEFENTPQGKDDVIKLWNEGWQCLFNALDAVSATNFDSKIKIRGENHTIIAAFHRQLAHYGKSCWSNYSSWKVTERR